MDRPLILFEGTNEGLAQLKQELERLGWRLLTGFTLPEVGWDLDGDRTVCVGPVQSEEEVQEVVLAAARGAGVVAALSPGDPLAGELYENLRRIGPVERRSPAGTGVPSLTPGDGRLLILLAQGLSVTEAARTLHISRRTAERRLAHVRRALNVRTTSEAVVASKRLRSQGQLPE